jgi:hypothetical protein
MNYENKIDPIKNVAYATFEFDIYKINEFREWKKLKTIKLINYQKKLNCSGSSGLTLFHKRNGKKLYLPTIETYDIYIKPEKYGVYEINKVNAFKMNYITLETLNTIIDISQNENWN